MTTKVPVVAVTGDVVTVQTVLSVSVENAVVVSVVAVEGSAVVREVVTGVVCVDSDTVVRVVAVVPSSIKHTYTQM